MSEDLLQDSINQKLGELQKDIEKQQPKPKKKTKPIMFLVGGLIFALLILRFVF